MLPTWRTAWAQTAPSTFKYYVSPTGSDSNPGTLAQPWAITSLSMLTWNANNRANWNKLNGAGVSVGLMPGTYDVSSMVGVQESNGALQLPGGKSGAPNYFASCNSSGAYSPRTAILDMKGASGRYGGRVGGPGNYDGPLIAHTGSGPPSGNAYAVGNLVIDGLCITGFSYKGIRIGGISSGDGSAISAPVTIQNCEFYEGGANVGDVEDNYAALWIDGTVNCMTVQNNYFHDTLGWHYYNNGRQMSGDHLNAIICWASVSAINSGTIIKNNTCVNAGNIYGKVNGIEGTTVSNNYIDVSMYTINSAGIQDFTGATSSGLTGTTTFNNNVILVSGAGAALGWPTLSNSYGYTTPISMYNNTIICTGGSGPVVAWATCAPAGAGTLKCYNNIYSTTLGATGSWNGFGNYYVNPSAPAVWDYNLFPASGVSWGLYQNALLTAQIANYSSASSFAAGLAAHGGISNAEAHGVAGTPRFTNTGSFAEMYQLASGSVGKGTGSTTGTASGTACDMGAWGNGATQIGCNFTAGTAIPMSPKLSVG